MAKRSVVKAESEASLTTPITEMPEGASSPWNLQVWEAMHMEGLTPGERRRGIAIALGLRTPRKRYKNKKERKAASKERREQRKKDRLTLYEQYGMTPRKRGAKLTPDEKRAKRSERGKKRRELLREMARANPELAKKYGVDPSRFKL